MAKRKIELKGQNHLIIKTINDELSELVREHKRNIINLVNCAVFIHDEDKNLDGGLISVRNIQNATSSIWIYWQMLEMLTEHINDDLNNIAVAQDLYAQEIERRNKIAEKRAEYERKKQLESQPENPEEEQ